MIAAFASTSSSLLAEFLVSFAAMIGGMIVFAGLLMEKIAERNNDKYSPPFLKPAKRLGEAGWKVLMAGIIIEIAVAGGSAKIDWETRQMVIKNDPRNQPLTDLSAVAIIVLNEPDFIETKAWDDGLITAMLRLHNADPPPNQLFGDFESLTIERLQRLTVDNLHEYIIHFEPSFIFKASFAGLNISSGWKKSPNNKLVKDLDDIHEIALKFLFIPANVEVLGGSVELIANGEISKRFLIPPLKADASPRLLPGLFLIATNSADGVQ